jgi:hypothetical protein
LKSITLLELKKTAWKRRKYEIFGLNVKVYIGAFAGEGRFFGGRGGRGSGQLPVTHPAEQLIEHFLTPGGSGRIGRAVVGLSVDAGAKRVHFVSSFLFNRLGY